jgi:hypothetical protein
MTNKSPSRLAKAVMVYVTDAKSQNAKKLAWKRARAVEHLHDFHGVPVGNIAAEILKRGGVEAVVRLAAEEDPIRPSKRDAENEGGTKIGKAGFGKGPRTQINAASADDHVSGEDSNDEPDDKPDPSSLEEGTMRVAISDHLRAKLEAVAKGQSVMLIGMRTDDWEEPLLFQVEKVVAVVKKPKLTWGKRAKA